nr:unknown Function [uncultured bacterium]
MDDAKRMEVLRRHWDNAGTDQDITHEIYHGDAVLEFPQSRERFVGKENFKAWRKIYPASVEFKIRRIRGRGDLWVAEISIRYDGGPWQFGCSILQFRDEKVARDTIYIAQGWEAPEWRAPWRAAWPDDDEDQSTESCRGS